MIWKFKDAENLAVIATTKVMKGEDWISTVFHDADDGGWQFLSGGMLAEGDAAVVSLRNIVDLEPSIAELSDLPLGWHAWRTSRTSPWMRSKT